MALHTGLLFGALAEVYLLDRPFSPWLGVPMLLLALGAQCLRWWCSVGDAAGYIDPLTGEGIGLAITCARAAVDCLVRGRAQDYERARRRLTRQHRVMTSALLWCAERPVLRARLVPLAARLPRVFTVAVNHLAA